MRRCKRDLGAVTVVNMLRSHLGMMTVIGEVYV